MTDSCSAITPPVRRLRSARRNASSGSAAYMSTRRPTIASTAGLSSIAVYADDLARGAHHPRGQESDVARSRADIEDAHARRDTGLLEQALRRRSDQSVLGDESLPFRFRAPKWIRFLGHAASSMSLRPCRPFMPDPASQSGGGHRRAASSPPRKHRPVSSYTESLLRTSSSVRTMLGGALRPPESFPSRKAPMVSSPTFSQALRSGAHQERVTWRRH